MPALGMGPAGNGRQHLLQNAPLAGAAEPQSAAPRTMEGACRCGRRRPVGVLLGLRSGVRPRLEGQWYCRESCLFAALEERARRDFPEGETTASSVRHRVPLGLLLQARGVISAAELQQALRLQAATGHRLGDLLRSHFAVPEERITGAVAAQWGLPVLHLPNPAAMAAQRIAPSRLFQASGTFPVERTRSGLLLACAEGPDPALALALERMFPLRVEFGVVSSSTLEQWRDTQTESAVPVQRVRCADRREMAGRAAEMLCRLQPVDSRLVRINGLWWLRMWLEEAARNREDAGESTDITDVLYSLEGKGASQRRMDE